jgi:MFS family permease
MAGRAGGLGMLRLFQLARFCVLTAMQMLSVAVGWQVYEITRAPISLGLVGLAQFLPMLGFSLLAGHVADRVDRRLVLVVCNGILVVVALAFTRVHAVALVYALLFVLGTARAFAGPASQALLPLLVDESYLARAIAQSSALMQAALVAGPALGGVLYRAGGGGAVFPVSAALLAVALVASGLVRPRRGAVEARARDLRTLFAGVAYVWRNKTLLGAMSLDMLGVLFGGAVALLPVYARDILHAGPVGLGLLRSAPAAGAALTGIWLAIRPVRARSGRKLLGAMACFGLAIVAFGLSRSFALSLLALFVAGASDMVNVVIRMTLVQLATPNEMRGRVSAVNLVFIGASNELGEMESGLTAQWWGPVAATIVGGACTVAIALAWGRFFPDLARIDRLDDVKPLA